MTKNSMYPEDTFLSDFIHKLNNHLMKMKINLEGMSERLEKEPGDSDFLAGGIKKQEEYVLMIAGMLKELKQAKMNEALILEEKKPQLTGRVLVIDDEKDLLRVMKRYLEKMGLEVEITTSGEEGLSRIRSKSYHYLITDLKMPGIDGQTLIKTAKDENLFEDTIVIAITGGLLNEYSPEQRDSLRSNIDGFLQKPFSREELHSLLGSFEPGETHLF